MRSARALGAPRAVLGARRASPRCVVRAAARAGASTSSKKFAIGFDVGTQGTKSILFDLDAHTVAGRGSYAYDLLPHPSRPNAAEQDPETWMDGIRDTLKQALREANADASSIVSVAVSGQQHGMVALDAAGAVVRPAKLWCDTESAPQAASISASEAFGGWPMAASFTASKVAWMRDEEPENFARTRTVLLPRDYVNLRLAGAVATEAGDASGLGVFDMRTRRYDEAQCDAVDERLIRMLPKNILPPDAAVGVVTREAAESTGLPAGCLVATGSGDNACAAIGVGATRPGRLVVSLGTSGVLFAANDGYRPDPATAVHTFCHALPDTWHQMGVILAATDALNWFARLVGQDAADLTGALGGKVRAPGKTLFLPYLGGERTPLNDAAIRGGLVGLEHATDRDAATRAVLEGVAFALCDSRDALAATGTGISSLLAVGGGSRSDYWLQVIATALNTPIDVPVAGDFGAAFGAARLAMMAATGGGAELAPAPQISRKIEPDPRLTDAFAEAHVRYRAARDSIRELT